MKDIFYKNLEYFLKRDNITKAQLERELGLGNASLRKNTEPRAKTLFLISRYFDTTMDMLYTIPLSDKD